MQEQIQESKYISTQHDSIPEQEQEEQSSYLDMLENMIEEFLDPTGRTLS